MRMSKVGPLLVGVQPVAVVQDAMTADHQDRGIAQPPAWQHYVNTMYMAYSILVHKICQHVHIVNCQHIHFLQCHMRCMTHLCEWHMLYYTTPKVCKMTKHVLGKQNSCQSPRATVPQGQYCSTTSGYDSYFANQAHV